MDFEKATERIKKYEGFSGRAYRCPAGEWTIGYGHLLKRGISKEVAEQILQEDILICYKELKGSLKLFNELDEVRQYVLVDMCFNIGLNRLFGFKKMLQALEAGDYKKAAAEMLASKWARQVGRRAQELSKIMEKGAY